MALKMLLELSIDDDGSVTGRMVERERALGPQPPPQIDGQTELESTIQEVEEERAGEEGRLFDAPKELDDNVAKAARRLRQDFAMEAEAAGWDVSQWQGEHDHWPPLVVQRAGKRFLVLTCSATEVAMADPTKGYSISKSAFAEAKKIARAEHTPLVYVFQDRSASRIDHLTLNEGKGAGGNFWVIPRSGHQPWQEVIS